VLPEQVLEVVSELFGVEAGEVRLRRRNSFLRSMAALMLCQHGALSQREATEVLAIRNGSAVSRQLRELNEAAKKDDPLQRLIRKASQDLREIRRTSVG